MITQTIICGFTSTLPCHCEGGRAATRCERTPLLSLLDVFCPVLSRNANSKVSLRGPLGPWQSQGIPLVAVYGRTIVYAGIYNGRYASEWRSALQEIPTVASSPAGDPVAALTVHRTVIHYRDCASLTLGMTYKSLHRRNKHRVTNTDRVRAHWLAALPEWKRQMTGAKTNRAGPMV